MNYDIEYCRKMFMTNKFTLPYNLIKSLFANLEINFISGQILPSDLGLFVYYSFLGMTPLNTVFYC